MKKAWRRLINKWAADSTELRREIKVYYANPDGTGRCELSFEPKDFLALVEGIEPMLNRPDRFNVHLNIPTDDKGRPVNTEKPGTTALFRFYYFARLSFGERFRLAWNELMDSLKVKKKT